MNNQTGPSASHRDRYVLVALVLGLVCSLYGIWWGWVESWNPDEMAFRNLFARGLLEPDGFEKPPFHTYVNFFLSVVPFKIIEWAGKAATGSVWHLGAPRLLWSRLIQVAFFLGIIDLSYRIAVRFAGVAAARIIALITASSAGLVIQTHFLTADVPVTFWMLAAFLAAQSIAIEARLWRYCVAGLLVGIATATKYNGLAVGLAIPIFHLFAARELPPWRRLVDPRLIAGVGMVIVGFVAANPYAVLDYPRFSADFAYNFAVTPVYGTRGGARYGFADFLLSIPEIVGWPVAAIVVIALSYALVRLRRASLMERATVAAALGVFLLYFFQFGRAPRVEIRFVVPVVTYLVIATASLWSSAIRQYRIGATIAAAALVAYNGIACAWVGKRFAEDPRMFAQAWVAAHVPSHSAIESSQYTPHWNLYRGVDVEDVRMPSVSGRARLLAPAFAKNRAMLQELSQREADTGIDWYTPQALAQRHPQFIALDSKYFTRFLNEDVAAGEYPAVRNYMHLLLANRLGYRTVFDRTARTSPAWLYPDDIDFLDNQIVILQKDED